MTTTLYKSGSLGLSQIEDPPELTPEFEAQEVGLDGKLFCFFDNPNEIFISDQFSKVEIAGFIGRLEFYDPLGKKEGEVNRKGIINFLARNSGRAVRDILGYKPMFVDGSKIYDDSIPGKLYKGHFIFGRIYCPNVENFSASVKVLQSEDSSAHFKIAIPVFNFEKKRELISYIDQELFIGHESVDLVIPATYKVVRWQNKNGNHFYITELKNYGELITKLPASNKYDHPKGFEELEEQKGTVSHISPTDYQDGTGPSFGLDINDEFQVGLEFPKLEELNIPGFGFHGRATAQEKVKISYKVVSNFKYVLFNALSLENRKFEHYWAHLPA